MMRILSISFLITLNVTAALSQTVRDSLVLPVSGKVKLAGFKENGPLIIIDEVVYDSLRIASTPALQKSRNPLELISAEEIESIHVLKSDAAMAVFGKKARYGALVIKTKSHDDLGRQLPIKKSGTKK